MAKQESKKHTKPTSSSDTIAKKTTAKSKVELVEEELDTVTGGAIDTFMIFTPKHNS